jgi:hypothetical protein
MAFRSRLVGGFGRFDQLGGAHEATFQHCLATWPRTRDAGERCRFLALGFPPKNQAVAPNHVFALKHI